MRCFLNDPEARFRRFPASLRRWNIDILRHRLRKPFRRRRWNQKNLHETNPYKITSRTGRHPDDRNVENHVVCILGDFSGKNGLSRAALYELARLRKKYSECEVHDFGDAIHVGVEVYIKPGPPIDRLYLLAAPDTYAILLKALCPERIAKAWRIGLWVWETPLFPNHWHFAIDLVDEIWTPSRYSQRAIARAVSPVPVHVQPHAVSVEVTTFRKSTMRTKLGVPETAFMGLAIMDIKSCPARKNPWAHVSAWLNAFGGDNDHVLILKLRVSRTTRVVSEELQKMISGAQNIRILMTEMTKEEVQSLQDEADVYLSLHRAEGYGLNIHECLALGTPVIATNFSANSEYGPTFEGYHGLPYRLVPYRDWTAHYPDKNFLWAEPDLEVAAHKLRLLANDHSSACQLSIAASRKNYSAPAERD